MMNHYANNNGKYCVFNKMNSINTTVIWHVYTGQFSNHLKNLFRVYSFFMALF